MRVYLAIILFLALVGTAIKPQPLYAQSSDESVRVKEIIVSGNRRVAVGTVLSYLPLQTGDLVSQSAINVALDQLYQTELFQDITIQLDGTVLRIEVQENPIINRVNIEGNDALADERLLEVLDVQPRRVYTRQLALNGAKRLLDIYKASGRFAAVVEPQIIELDENRVDLAFVVDEGPLIKIKSITFNGNDRFSDYALRGAISSRVNRWWAVFSSSDKYDEGRLDYDVRLLRQYYLARGYADINVSRVKGGLLPDRTGFAVTFLLEEGLRYKVGDITVDSEIENVDLDELKSLITFGDDGWYDVRRLEQGLLDITNKLGTLGYAFVDVSPDVVTDPETQTLALNISIGKAQKNYVERIEIIDNSRTQDRVVRREFELVEGDAFNQLKLDRSIRNIRNLGYFREVSVRNLEGSSPDQTVTEVTVEEQSTGELSIGVGYSSIDKATFSLGINERNFLGTGRSLEATLGISDSRTDFRLGVTEPYLFNRNLTGSGAFFNEKFKQGGTSTTQTGFDFGVGFTAAGDIYHRMGYELSQAKTSTTSTTATSVTGENGENILKSAASYTLGKDTRDNRFDPSEGYLMEVSEELAGLGGDATYAKTTARGAYYKPFLFNRVVLGVKGRGGYVTGLGEKVTQSQRFILGGRLVRGFAGAGIGPRDIGNKAAVGGNQYYSGSAEIVSDLGLSKDLGVRWTVFTDVGSTWGTDYPTGVQGASDSSMRSSLGFGILWDTVLGPLSFYWADPIAKKSYDKTKRFQFTIGTRL